MYESLSLIGALAVGLLGGVHCVGMCGAIVGVMSVTMPGDKAVHSMPLMLGYNAGRIFSYTIAGAIFGGFGQMSIPLLQIQSMQSVLAVIAGTMLLLMGFYLGGWSQVLRHVEKVGALLWARIEPFGRRLLPVRTARQSFLLGTLWGWLPCGLVYSMLIWALGSGSAINGAMLLFAFGLGTLPNLLATGLLANQFSRFMQQLIMRRIAGLLLICFGLYTLIRLTG